MLTVDCTATIRGMTAIHAVLFDFGKVLSKNPDPKAWSRLRELTGLSEDELHHRYWLDRDDYDAGLLTGDEYWSRITPQPPTPDLLAALKATDLALWTDMNIPMLDWVSQLHKSGFRTGILSNMPDAMADGICARFDWIENFDHTVWSHEHKMRKPQPAIYALAAAGLTTPPEHILFIDDKEENTRAAEAFGMQAIVYCDHAIFEQTMRDRGWGHLLQPMQH
jgi:putative hydrolase of the HAD superfamily